MKNKASNLNTTFTFAEKRDDAELLYLKYKSFDPLPKIQPALLNSADIAEYVCKTGMVFPFSNEKLKPAGYEAEIGKEVWYWDSDKKKQHNDNLQKTDSICFRRNSITYISLKETFQIPDYIALRFNLTIKHVHRGVLLGTGPLIDPGFQGKIMIPIHNLTPNDYIVRPGDPIISIEFTKLSPNNIWNQKIPKGKGDYVPNSMAPFPPFSKYFEKALPNGIKSVNSSIGNIMENAETSIRRLKYFAWGTTGTIVVALFAAMAPLFYYTWQSYNSSNVYVTNAEQYLIEANNKFNNKLEETINQNIVTLTDNKIIKAVEKIFLDGSELDSHLNRALEEKIKKLQHNELLEKINKIIEINTALEKRNAELESKNAELVNAKR